MRSLSFVRTLVVDAARVVTLVLLLQGCSQQNVASVLRSAPTVGAHPNTYGTIDEFPIPNCPSGACQPAGITLGPDGEIWFTDYLFDQPGEIDTAGNFKQFALGNGNGYLWGITSGSDGNLWMAAPNVQKAGQVIKMTPLGEATYYTIPGNAASGPWSITSGPDGNIWFGDPPGTGIGQLTPDGQLTVFPLPNGMRRTGQIKPGPDGNLWFVNGRFSNHMYICKLGKITPSGVIQDYLVSRNCQGINDLTAAPDGHIWFTNGNQIGRMTVNGFHKEYPIPESGATAIGIAVGPDNNIWFTESNGYTSQGWIVRAMLRNPSQMTEYPLPMSGWQDAYFITAGSDGNMWFTIPGVSAIGRIHLH